MLPNDHVDVDENIKVDHKKGNQSTKSIISRS